MWQHTTSRGDRHAELTTIGKELTRANTAIDRYLQAFEDGDWSVPDFIDTGLGCQVG